MKTKNIKQKVTETKSLKVKLLVISITTGALFLSGCQEQMIGLSTLHRNLDTPDVRKKTILKPIPARLASRITFVKTPQENNAKVFCRNVAISVNSMDVLPKYQRASISKLDLNKQSWKDSYDGKGVPILKISF